MKLKAFAILFIIIVAIMPAYYLVKYVERRLKPRESVLGLVIYLLLTSFIIFLFVIAIVSALIYLIIPVFTKLFGGAS